MRHYKKKNYLFILPNTKVNKKIFLRFYSTNTLLKYKKYFIKKTEIKKNIKLKNKQTIVKHKKIGKSNPLIIEKFLKYSILKKKTISNNNLQSKIVKIFKPKKQRKKIFFLKKKRKAKKIIKRLKLIYKNNNVPKFKQIKNKYQKLLETSNYLIRIKKFKLNKTKIISNIYNIIFKRFFSNFYSKKLFKIDRDVFKLLFLFSPIQFKNSHRKKYWKYKKAIEKKRKIFEKTFIPFDYSDFPLFKFKIRNLYNNNKQKKLLKKIFLIKKKYIKRKQLQKGKKILKKKIIKYFSKFLKNKSKKHHWKFTKKHYHKFSTKSIFKKFFFLFLIKKEFRLYFSKKKNLIKKKRKIFKNRFKNRFLINIQKKKIERKKLILKTLKKKQPKDVLYINPINNLLHIKVIKKKINKQNILYKNLKIIKFNKILLNTLKKTEIKKNIKLKNRFKNFFTIKTKIISNNLNLNSELDLLIK